MNEIYGFDESLLPPQLKRILRAVGATAAMRLLKRRGGTRLRLPRSPNELHQLVELIGLEATQALVAAFPDMPEITLPKADKLVAQLRNLAILMGHQAGESITTLALEFDLTTRQVLNILKAGRESVEAPDFQGELFAPVR